MLARLFDGSHIKPGKAKNGRKQKLPKDIGSIPMLVHLLKQKRCKSHLIAQARLWTPFGKDIEDAQATCCAKATEEALRVYPHFRQTSAGKRVLSKLRSFRDNRLAHSLLKDASKPSYDDLFLLTDIARDFTQSAMLAICGGNLSLKEVETQLANEARAFWRPALVCRRKNEPTMAYG